MTGRTVFIISVSYTHLDVYKRQVLSAEGLRIVRTESFLAIDAASMAASIGMSIESRQNSQDSNKDF